MPSMARSRWPRRAARHRREQPARVGMLRVAEDRAHRPVLDDAPGVHDGDAVGGFGDDAEIVRDEQQRQVEAPTSSRAAGRESRA